MSQEQVQLLWSRSAVFIHPTKRASENIVGYLSLVKPNDGEILISWVPESLIRMSKTDYDSYVQVDFDQSGKAVMSKQHIFVNKPPSLMKNARSTHAFSVPISQVFSMQAREPSLGWWYGSLLLFTKNQEALPALFFHDDESAADKKRRLDLSEADSPGGWGGKIFMDILSAYANIVPSSFEKGVYLVNPDQKDKVAFASSAHKPGPNDGKPLPYQTPTWTDVKWNLFEKLAQVTRVSRRASQKVFDRTPASVRAMLNIPEVEQLGQDFDSARVFLAEWALGIAQDQQDIQKKKLDVVWSDSGIDDDFLLVSTQSAVERRNPVTLDEWNHFFNEDDGRLLITVNEVKDKIFHGGLEPPVRAEAWLFLLGVYPWDSDKVERLSLIAEKRNEYYRLKRQWWEDINRQNKDEFWKDQKSRIEKDVLRTDRSLPIFSQSEIPHPDPESRFAASGANPHLEQLRDILVTYNEYNQNLGYVQGMSDLLSPLYVVLQDDSLAFIAFCAFMNRMERNFMRSQEGMRDQLQTLGHLTHFMLPSLHAHLAKADSIHFFFFFRMILVWYKREYEWDEVLKLWEVLWTNFYSSQFHLFVALAVLDLNKDIIMGRLHYFDEILKYVNDLGMTMDLDIVLTRAEQLFTSFRMAIDLVERQSLERKQNSSPNSASTPAGPEITVGLRVLLSKRLVEQHETERPQGAGGG